MGRIYLSNCWELDVNNNVTLDFSSKEEQLQYFVNKRVVDVITNTTLVRKQDISVKVAFKYWEVELANYCCVFNENLNKWFYYFIIDRVAESQSMTRLILKLDVIQTYFFDFQFRSCLVERCHVPRWTNNGLPNRRWIAEEGLECGEYEIKNIYTMYDYNDKGAYIIASGDCLGVKTQQTGGGSSTPIQPSTGVGYQSGKVSKMMLACLKSYEGYYDHAYDIGDGTLTIGYGTTSAYEPQSFAELQSNCTEQKATEIMVANLENNYAKGILNAMHSKGLLDNDIKQNEFDAFVDLAYNCGVGGATESPMFIAYCNKKSADEVISQWGTYYINAGTSNEQGLRNRRAKEINIFKNNSYEFHGISKNGNSTVTENNGLGFIPQGYE